MATSKISIWIKLSELLYMREKALPHSLRYAINRMRQTVCVKWYETSSSISTCQPRQIRITLIADLCDPLLPLLVLPLRLLLMRMKTQPIHYLFCLEYIMMPAKRLLLFKLWIMWYGKYICFFTLVIYSQSWNVLNIMYVINDTLTFQ